MPTKTTDHGREYRIDGREFTWITEDGAEIVVPLSIKLGLLRRLGATGADMDLGQMFAILEALIPGQTEMLDELDVMMDFTPMFETWQTEYEALSGATLGEPQRSSA